MVRKLMRRTVILLGFGLLLPMTPVLGHHSFVAQYDASQPITLSGEVTKVEWANPHVYFYIDVTAEDGEVTNWAVEVGAPNGLRRQGWGRDSLNLGDLVTVDAFRARNGDNHVNGRTITVEGGRRLFSGQNDGGPQY